MAITDNQIIDKFQADLGRKPTPFEITKYSTASIPDFTNLKNTYSSYKPDQSIVDHLAYQGLDSSMKSRSDLAAKYGISGYTGNYDQNVALLNAIKKGPPSNIVPAVNGSISSAAPTTDTTQPKVDGSISTAAAPMNDPALVDNTNKNNTENYGATPTESPEITQSRQARDAAYNNLVSLKKQRDDINNAINQTISERRDQISRAGGLVSESQLRSDVLAENAPLLAERNALSAQISEANGNYSVASKDYNDTVSQSFKKETLNQGQQKIDQNAVKISDTETQNAIKNALAANKPIKVPVTDSAGNVLGQKIVTWHNPASTVGISSDGQIVSINKDASGNISMTQLNTNTIPGVSSDKPLPKLTISGGATPAQVFQSLTSGPNKNVKGVIGGVNQETLYNAAIDLMMGIPSTTGARIPAAAAFAVQDKKTEIMNAYGLTEPDVNIAKTQVKNLSAANSSLLQRAAFTNLAASIASDNLKLAIKQSEIVPRGGAKFVNNYTNWLKGEFTPAGDLAQLETYIYTYAREYGKVTSGSAASVTGLTDSAQAEADKLINAAQSPEVFAKVAEAMGNDMQNVMNENNKATASLPDSIKKLYGGVLMGGASTTGIQKGEMSDTDYVNKVLTAQGVKYNDFISKVPAGKIPVIDNSTGETGYLDNEGEFNSNYTRI